jgi:ESCRT-II complex subunit VPS25
MDKVAVDFSFPEIYSFPPFFTLQPVPATLEKQLLMWCELVLAYCAHHKINALDVKAAESSPLFCNKSLQSMFSCSSSIFFMHVGIRHRYEPGKELSDKKISAC